MLDIEQVRKNTNMHLNRKNIGNIYTKIFGIVIVLMGTMDGFPLIFFTYMCFLIFLQLIIQLT